MTISFNASSQATIGLALLGAVIPVSDFLCQTILDRGPDLLDPTQAPPPDLLDVLRNDLRNGVALRPLLERASDPAALGPVEQRCDRGLALG
jgi:hypothetical protein